MLPSKIVKMMMAGSQIAKKLSLGGVASYLAMMMIMTLTMKIIITMMMIAL